MVKLVVENEAFKLLIIAPTPHLANSANNIKEMEAEYMGINLQQVHAIVCTYIFSLLPLITVLM